MTRMRKRIADYLEEKKIAEKVSLFCYNTVSKETYFYREQQFYLAASTIKVPVCMAWFDLIEKGIASEDTKLVYLDRHYEESDDKALYDTYQYGDCVPLKECMELAIVYSDNPSNHMMQEYYASFADKSFREWFAGFSRHSLPKEFYTSNLMNAEIMLEVMKKLVENSDRYSMIIEFMKRAAEGRYIQANHFGFEVAQKYGEYEQFEHTMAILYDKEPLLVGIFTELAQNNAKEVIKDLSRIMAEG